MVKKFVQFVYILAKQSKTPLNLITKVFHNFEIFFKKGFHPKLVGTPRTQLGLLVCAKIRPKSLFDPDTLFGTYPEASNQILWSCVHSSVLWAATLSRPNTKILSEIPFIFSSQLAAMYCLFSKLHFLMAFSVHFHLIFFASSAQKINVLCFVVYITKSCFCRQKR